MSWPGITYSKITKLPLTASMWRRPDYCSLTPVRSKFGYLFFLIFILFSFFLFLFCLFLLFFFFTKLNTAGILQMLFGKSFFLIFIEWYENWQKSCFELKCIHSKQITCIVSVDSRLKNKMEYPLLIKENRYEKEKKMNSIYNWTSNCRWLASDGDGWMNVSGKYLARVCHGAHLDNNVTEGLMAQFQDTVNDHVTCTCDPVTVHLFIFLLSLNALVMLSINTPYIP